MFSSEFSEEDEVYKLSLDCSAAAVDMVAPLNRRYNTGTLGRLEVTGSLRTPLTTPLLSLMLSVVVNDLFKNIKESILEQTKKVVSARQAVLNYRLV